MARKIKVFVYGTLKKGFRNHHFLEDFKGEKAFAPGIDLHKGEAPFPYAKRGESTAIGELYEIDDETFKMLDKLEGHPSFYRREETRIVGDGIDTTAWIYLYSHADQYPAISNGMFV